MTPKGLEEEISTSPEVCIQQHLSKIQRGAGEGFSTNGNLKITVSRLAFQEMIEEVFGQKEEYTSKHSDLHKK